MIAPMSAVSGMNYRWFFTWSKGIFYFTIGALSAPTSGFNIKVKADCGNRVSLINYL